MSSLTYDIIVKQGAVTERWPQKVEKTLENHTQDIPGSGSKAKDEERERERKKKKKILQGLRVALRFFNHSVHPPGFLDIFRKK